MAPEDMAAFWDRRAEEDPFYFVDTRLDYRSPDLDSFWAEGEHDLDALLGVLSASLSPTDAVLEIGCGVGRLTRVLGERCARVVAVDVSTRMLALARELNPGLENVSWLTGDGSSLRGVEDSSVDVCISHVVFQHVPDPQVTLGYVREMGRVLRPGGCAAFQVSNDAHAHRPLIGPRHRIAALLGRAPGGQEAREWLGSAVEIEQLRAAADDGGMDIERIAYEGTQFCAVRARRRSSQGSSTDSASSTISGSKGSR